MISIAVSGWLAAFVLCIGIFIGARLGMLNEREKWLELLAKGLKLIVNKNITSRDFVEYISVNARGVADDGWLP